MPKKADADGGASEAADGNGERLTKRAILARMADYVRASDAAACLKAAEAGLQLYPRNRRMMDAYISALDLNGEPRQALALAVKAAERRSHRLEKARTGGQPRTLTRDTRIFLSGYFYSGSGAVLDYLADFSGVAKWSPAGEPRLIKFSGGLADLTKRSRAKGALEDQDLLDFYLHIVGAKADPAPEGHYSHWGKVNRHSIGLLKAPTAAGYIARCLDSFRALAQRSRVEALTPAVLAPAFRACVATALDAAATDTDADCLLIDQAVNAWRLPISAAAPPSTFIIVHRDPRDQFADAMIALNRPGRTPLSAEAYAVQYRARRDSAARAIPIIERDFGHRVIQLSFEEFVMRHAEESARLLSSIGFDARPNVRRSYDVTASRRNIGKFRDLVPAEDAAILAAALPEFLSPDMPA